MNNKDSRLFLLPVDNSPHSERAFDWYLKHLYKPGDKVGIIHVHEPPHIGHEAFGVWDRMIVDGEERWKRDYKKSVEEANNVIDKYKQKANDAGVESKSFIKTSPYGAGYTICELAEKENASGIIMGSRGLNLLRRTFLGSVSSYVVNHANTPVTVTPPATEEAKK